MLKKHLTDLRYLTMRNMKVFLKDRSSLLCSLITPFVLVFLYVTFLNNVYEESLMGVLKQFGILEIPSNILHGFSAGWLMSSIMATTCVTLTFCSNTIVVSDKISGAINDIQAAPVNRLVISFAYFAANCISTLAVCSIALALGFIYIAIVGWFLSFGDVILILCATVLLTLFGSLFASILMTFITNQGGITACSVIVSALYGFICGAYMPISSFGQGLANILYCLPGTYGTMTLRHYFTSGALDALQNNLASQLNSAELAEQALSGIKQGFDIQIKAFDNTVSISSAFLIVGLSVVVLAAVYSAIVYLVHHSFKKESFKRKTD